MKPANVVITYIDPLNEEKTSVLTIKARDRHDSMEHGYIHFASEKYKGCKLINISSDLK